MKANKVTIPAGTKLAIGILIFFTVPVLLLGILDPVGLLVLLAYAVATFLAALLVYLVVFRISITATRRLAYHADLWLARRRAEHKSLGENYCLLLRSTQSDVALSIDDSDGRRIRDANALRLDIAPSFRSLLAHRMQPLYTLLVKNSELVGDVVSVTYADAEWKAQIAEDMKSASLIFLIPHWPSEALAWEMQQLHRGGHLWKTFVVVPPSYLFRPGVHAQPAYYQRLVDRFRYMTRETLEAVAPDYFVNTRHIVSLEAERIIHAKSGWESSRFALSQVGLRLPDFDPNGAFLLAASLAPPSSDATASALDSYRIAVDAGTLDWRSDTTSRVLLSVARGG